MLYNIAGCYRELSRYSEAVKFYTRFLAEGSGKVPTSRLSDAQVELDHIYALIARVTVKVQPADGAALLVDGAPIGTLPIEMPLILRRASTGSWPAPRAAARPSAACASRRATRSWWS